MDSFDKIWNVCRFSQVSPKHALNEDAYGYKCIGRSVVAWVIDGATPLEPSTNQLVHNFVTQLSIAICEKVNISDRLDDVLNNGHVHMLKTNTELVAKLRALPRYAQPIAAIALVRLTQKKEAVHVETLILGDCAVVMDRFVSVHIARSSCFINRLREMYGRHGKEVLSYQRGRRRRQMANDYCRWLTVDGAGLKRATLESTSTADRSGHILLCSDGFYEPLLEANKGNWADLWRCTNTSELQELALEPDRDHQDSDIIDDATAVTLRAV